MVNKFLKRRLFIDQSFCIDTDANAFIINAGISDVTQQGAICNLVQGLKIDNLWSKLKAIYPIIGGTASTHKYNLKNPLDTDAAFRLDFVNSFNHDSNGIRGNANQSAYANTFLTPSIDLTNNNTHISVYSGVNSLENNCQIGCSVSASSRYSIFTRLANDVYFDSYNSTTGRIQESNIDASGFYLSSRTASNVHKGFKNSVQVGATNIGASPTIPNIPLYIMARNNNGTADLFSTRIVSFATVGDGLSDAEQLNLYNRIQTYQTTLGRNV